MSPVDFKIWQYPLSLLDFLVDFEIDQCQMSNLRNTQCHVSNMFFSCQ